MPFPEDNTTNIPVRRPNDPTSIFARGLQTRFPPGQGFFNEPFTPPARTYFNMEQAPIEGNSIGPDFLERFVVGGGLREYIMRYLSGNPDVQR